MDELKTAEGALAAEAEKLQQLKKESVAKTTELADSTENESKLAGEIAALAKQIGKLADQIAPLRITRDEKMKLVQDAQKVVDRWQNEAEFAQARIAKD